MADAMWDVLDEYESQETGGGGLIGKILFEIGYKAFISGLANEDSFFAFVSGDESSKTAAKGKCDALLNEHGVDKRSQVCMQFRVYKSEVLGREVTWKGDRFFTHPLWTEGYKLIVRPALKESGAEFGDLWGRIGFADDPSGRLGENAQGEEVIQKIEYLVEVYKHKAAAEAAASEFAESGDGNGGASGVIVPDGYTTETWLGVKKEILDALGDNPTPGDIVKMATAYGAEPEAVKALLA